jgi:hypothetical protein
MAPNQATTRIGTEQTKLNVAMYIADRPRCYAEMHRVRVLVDGWRLAIQDVVGWTSTINALTVPNIPMAEDILDQPRIQTLVGEHVPGAVAQHVGMDGEGRWQPPQPFR